MINKESLNKDGYIASVKILDVEKRYKPGSKHYVYVIEVNWSNPTNLFIIYRRYAQFFDLQCKLLDMFAETSLGSRENTQSRRIPFLPGKIILGRSQIRQIALERKQALNNYCQTLISLPERISRSLPVIEFFHPLATDLQKPIESIVATNRPLTKNSLVISEPSQLPNYRCIDDFTAVDKLEISLKRNTIVEVLQRHDSGWWFVQNGDQKGFVPGSYLKSLTLEQNASKGQTCEKPLSTIYVVNHKYDGKKQDELSLDQGSFVTVIEKSFSGWWTVKFNHIVGQFPAVYLSSCEGLRTPDDVSDESSSIVSKTQELTGSSDSDWDDDEEYHIKPCDDRKAELYYAHSNLIDNIGDCLSCQRGDSIEIHEKHSSGWWFGRRTNGDNVLGWVPGSFLQKEPILDTKNNQSVNCEHHSKMSSAISNPSFDKQQQEKDKLSNDTVYCNLESQISMNTMPSNVKKIIEGKNADTKTCTHTSTPPKNDKQDATPHSVKDLIKKFNER